MRCWTGSTILFAVSMTSTQEVRRAESDVLIHPRISLTPRKAQYNGRLSTQSTSAPSPTIPAERYDFRACPFTQWMFPSTISGLADLISYSNGTKRNPWSCGRHRGLELKPQSFAHLETHVLDEFWSNHFHSDSASTALVVSLWFRPDHLAKDVQPILTWTTPDHSRYNVSSLGCSGYELQIALYLNRVLIRYRDDDEAQSCKILYPRMVNASELSSSTSNHLILTLGSGSTSVFLNGQYLYRDLKNSFNTTPTERWDATHLQVFGTRAAQERFRGAIHELSLFEFPLSDSEVLKIYQDGLDSFDDRSDTHPDLTTNESAAFWEFDIPDPNTEAIPQGIVQSVTIDLVGHDEKVTQATILNLCIEFTQLPVVGNLTMQLPNETSSAVEKHSRLHVFGDSPVSTVVYSLSNLEYFNTPKIDALGSPIKLHDWWAGLIESFAYRVVVVDDDGFIVATVPEERAVVQAIAVQHVNHPPILKVPEQAVLPAQNAVDSWALLCSGIQVHDSQDHDLDLIRVDVMTNQGHLTLNPQNRSMADFLSCRGRSQSAWQCLGDGVSDRRMTFVTVPSKVEYILQDLRYEGFVLGAEDEIFIALYDGADDEDCLSTEEHEDNSRIVGSNAWSPITRTISYGCYRVNATIKVPSLDNSTQGDHGHDEPDLWGIPNSDVTSFDLPDLLFWIVLAGFICVLCVCCGRSMNLARRFFQARGSGVDLEGGSYFHNSSASAEGPVVETEISNRVVIFTNKNRDLSLIVRDADRTRDSVFRDDDDDNSSLTAESDTDCGTV